MKYIPYILPTVAVAFTACNTQENSVPATQGEIPAQGVPASPEQTPIAPGKKLLKMPGSVSKIVPEDGISSYKIYTDNEIILRVEFFGADCFRIQAGRNGSFEDPKNDPAKAQILVDKLPINWTFIDVKQGGDKIIFTSDALVLSLDKKSCTFSLAKKDGELIWRETKPLEMSDTGTTQHLSTDADEFYYGGGQQNGYFSHKGTKIAIVADGNWNEGGHPNPAPFYMSNRGYGVLRHTFATGSYDFTGTQSIALEHDEDRFDAFYFVGDSFNRVLDLYTQFTGRPNFIPRWGFGIGDADAYMTRDSNTKEPKVEADGTYTEITPYVIDRIAKKYREHNMPGDWILVNDGYGCGYTQLPYVVKSLAELGFHTGLWTEGALVKTKFEVGTAGTRVQKLDVAWSGPAYQHGLTCNKSAYDSFIDNSNARPFIWTVQGWAGTQRYGICWTGDQSGDWDLIRYHIPTLITSGMSGQAYATTDVDGIFGGSPETYTRDLQWKCFTPAIYVMNGWASLPKSPWNYEEPYRSINRKYLRLKSAMTPYMYKYAHDAAETGAPIVRGMVWNFPNDRKTWGKATQYQFMLGDSVLVAPVYTSMVVNKGWRKEDIYLPEGEWIDYWDGRRIQGPFTIDAYPITLDKLPVFIRGGAIIPMYPERNYDAEKQFDPLTFEIYPYGNSSFEMYEDEGSSRDWEKGEFAKQLISCNAPKGIPGDINIVVGPSVGSYAGKPTTRVYKFAVHVPTKPKSIELDGEMLSEISEKDFEKSEQGWFYDRSRSGIIRIKLARRSVDDTVSVLIYGDENATFPKSEPYPIPPVTADLDKSEFVVTCSSEQGGASIRNAFDGSPETIWHSNYSKEETKHPYTIDVDLRSLVAVNGLGYLPREGISNGAIKGYEIYVSRTPGVFGEPIVKGEFMKEFDETSGKKKPKYQKISFATTWGRYVRIKVLSAINGDRFGSAAEFDILQDIKATPLAEEKIAAKAMEKSASVSGTISYEGANIVAGVGSEITYKLDGSWDKLRGNVGRNSASAKGNVTFRVFADGKQIFERAGQKPNDVKQLLDVNISGVKELKLSLVSESGIADDTGIWMDLEFVRKGSE